MFAKWTRPHGTDDAETWLETTEAPTVNGWEMRHDPPPVLISSTEDSPARTCQWPENGPVFPASVAASGMSSDGCCENCGHDGRSLRMFPASLAHIAAETSRRFSWNWKTSGMGGPTEFWTRDVSAAM